MDHRFCRAALAASASARGRVVALPAALIVLISASALSQDLQTVDLGDGLRVTLRLQPCVYDYDGARCPIWDPSGFEFGDRQILGYAYAFARVPSSGRVVAVYRGAGDRGGLRYARDRGGVLYTDDLGATWRAGRWRWRHAARALAFDAGSDFGVAAGEAGYVWNTDDGGERWTVRRRGGPRYTQVAVIGRVVVLVNSQGDVWRSRDGGFARNSLARAHEVSLRTTGDAIVVTTSRETLHVHADGSVERSD